MTDTTRQPTPSAALHALQRAFEAQTAGEVDLTARVLAARSAGAPVNKIAETLGVPQPTVSRDYLSQMDPVERERLAGLQYRPVPEGQWAAAMRAVARARDVRDRARGSILTKVAVCRERGVVWREIAAVLGRATPNVIATYGRLLKVETQKTVSVVDPDRHGYRVSEARKAAAVPAKGAGHPKPKRAS